VCRRSARHVPAGVLRHRLGLRGGDSQRAERPVAGGPDRPNGTLFAPFIGLGLAILIVILAPLTQAGFNPARDLGPRLVSYFAGWGRIAIPGPRGGFFTVYILAPMVGGVVGGAVYDWVIRPGLTKNVATDEHG
jgi:hypothetical protein